MRKGIALLTAMLMMVTVALTGGGAAAQAASSKTGTGLADHVLTAYNNNWKYRSSGYGQFSGNTRVTDCSGLIKSYLWWQGEGKNPKPGAVAVAGSSGAMLNSAKESGTINYSDESSLPRIHGLILYEPGHVGVYIGNNLAVDNRDYNENMKCENVFGRKRPKWKKWFKLPQVTYPTTGWENFNGQKYYYEDGQYVINTTKTIDGVTYTFGADGTITQEVPAA